MKQSLQKLSVTLKGGGLVLLDRTTMLRYFVRRMQHWYPGMRITALRIVDHSQFLFKKSIAYHVSFVDRCGIRSRLTIRGNVPSRDTTEEARNADRAMRAIWRNDLHSKNLPISRPLGYDERLRVLFYEEVPGQTLTSLLQTKPTRALSWVGKAGRWLGTLHAHAIRAGRPRGVRREKLESYFFSLNYGTHYAACLPKTADALREYFVLRKRYAKDIERESRLLHGDYGPKNIIVSTESNQLNVIDFGNSWRYDPMSDLANALVQLEYTNKVPAKTVRAAQTALLRGYTSRFPLTGTRPTRLHLFTAWWSLQTLSYIFTLPFTQNYSELASASLRRITKALHDAR